MNPAADEHTIPADLLADMALVAEHLASGKPLDAESVRRITERSREAQEKLVETFGVREIAVDLIRGARDEE